MAEKVLMLALSPTMEEGSIVKWHKKEGDTVASGDILCEVETDKATMEYESINEGTLLKVLVAEGEKARVEDPIAIVGEQGEDISQLLEEVRQPSGKPEVSESTGVEGKSFEGESLASEAAEVVEEGKAGRPPKEEAMLEPSEYAESPQGVKASPLARRLAEQHHLDLSILRGSGPGGRIVKRDIEGALRGPAPSLRPGMSGPERPLQQQIPVSGKRKVIAKRLSESKFSAPHYYLRVTARVDDLVAARSELNRSREEKVSLNAFLIRIAAEAMKRHPMVNATWNGDTITQYNRADIGLAVAQPDGLITPIVKDCWRKGILEIDEELRLLVDKAKNNRLKPEEYTGATFTISNLGSYGIDEFTAIINPPGSAILAVGRIRKEPVIKENDEIVVQSGMTLTLSCDHRIIDGATGALFLKELKDLVESPIRSLY